MICDRAALASVPITAFSPALTLCLLLSSVAPFGLHWAHLGNPGSSPGDSYLNHICKAPLAVVGTIFTGCRS
jgi:hypothetical protein